MCKPKDEGLRCPNHAGKAVVVAAKKYHKVFKENPETTNESFQKISAAKLEHEYAKDIYYASTKVLATLSKKTKTYHEHEKMNIILKNLGKNKKDTDNTTPIQIGNKINITNRTLTKTLEGKYVAVNTHKNNIILWNKNQPSEIIKITENTKTVIPLPSYQNPSDIQWVIWYTRRNKNLF